MRKTVVLDDDVNHALRQKMRKTGLSFKQVVNDYLRAGFGVAQREQAKQVKVEPRTSGTR